MTTTRKNSYPIESRKSEIRFIPADFSKVYSDSNDN